MWYILIYIYIAITSISGPKKKSPNFNFPQFHSKKWKTLTRTHTHTLGVGSFSFQCFVFFVIIAFSCLSFSSVPQFLDFLKPKVAHRTRLQAKQKKLYIIYIYIVSATHNLVRGCNSHCLRSRSCFKPLHADGLFCSQLFGRGLLNNLTSIATGAAPLQKCKTWELVDPVVAHPVTTKQTIYKYGAHPISWADLMQKCYFCLVL